MTNENGSAVATQDDVRGMLETSKAVQHYRELTAVEIARGKAQADLLTKQGAQWLKDANPNQIIAFARACIALDLNPLVGEAYLIHGGIHVGIAGRRKLAQRTGEWEGEEAPRLPTPEEQEIHGVRKGDVARVVTVWRKGMRFPGIGVGIVRRGEIDAAMSGRKGPDGLPFSPLGRDPEGMAAKRAANAAYKRSFPDLDLPTADTDDRGRVIDVESGEVLDATVVEREREERADRRLHVAAAATPQEPEAESLESEDGVSVEEPDAEAVLRAKVIAACREAFPPGDAPTPEQIATMFGGVPLAEVGDYGMTDDEAVAIAAAIWASDLVISEGLPLDEVAARVHRKRAHDGLSFVPDAIPAEPEPDVDQVDEAEAERGRDLAARAKAASEAGDAVLNDAPPHDDADAPQGRLS